MVLDRKLVGKDQITLYEERFEGLTVKAGSTLIDLVIGLLNWQFFP